MDRVTEPSPDPAPPTKAPCAHAAEQGHDHNDHDHDHDHDASAPSSVSFSEASGGTLSRFRIEAMDCPTEQTLLQKRLGAVAGVQGLEFNLINRVLGVRHSLPDTRTIESAITEVGMTAVPLTDAQADAAQAPAPDKRGKPALILGFIAAGAAEVCHLYQVGPPWLVIALALLAICTTGLGTYRKGWIAVRQRNLNINALMSLAVTGAALIGQWPEAAMVMVLFALAERIEARSLERARNAIGSLMQLAPETATVQDEQGQWVSRKVADITVGSLLRARPGERIALDGEVTSGRSTINQAPITGESLPVDKTVGDAVFAGTVNEAGELEYRATQLASESTLGRILKVVEQAQGSRAPTQRFVDRFSRLYTPAVMLLACAVAVLPPLFGFGAWLDWVYRGLVLLVVACPCALVISTPVTLVSGLAAAARRGILVKGGAYLEMAHSLEWLALDKTGTLTQGKPVLTDTVPFAGDVDAAKAIAASLASRSDHPVSKALAAGLSEVPAHAVADFEAIAGRGSRGRVNGQAYTLGNHRLVEALGLCSAPLEAVLEGLEQAGKSVVVLCDSQQPLAVFGVADTLRDTSTLAIAALHELGVKTMVLSGDNQAAVSAIAAQVGIDEARGNLLPQDKLAAIETLAGSGKAVGMVGDGINDAPALARANIGFAMGAAGSHTAIETADVALMDDDLRKVGEFIALSRRTRRLLIQNIVLALGIKAVFLVLTLLGMATLWMAVFADMGVSLLVVFNGLRLLRAGPPTSRPPAQ
ncbi:MULTISPECIES: heavy metal translocating P-type ATPase [Pseudomonas]|uniref:P-type Zn(2+) transporter n=1 Tax=Pseudomonas quercus TaxID=2722792 RepID=A0ABX0YI14_9PSED|nr:MULTISPECIES: heavy metal translocating P-type ATPase [Pseudomonas]MBF7144207.1 heavy metal translocating P-type ATPase [Pseudomonas sp. LY10J]NJP02661.1 heavy metal translocating P-type ATPase [Pseudomonas quercus]